MRFSHPFRLATPLGAAMFSLSAQAASFTWPAAVAPCDGTLQSCVDAVAAPSIVYVAADNVVNTGPAGQDLRLSRSVSLAAASGFNPVFPVGVGIVSTPSSSIEIGISGITLRDAGITLLPSAGGSFYVAQMRLLDNAGTGGIDFEALGTAAAYLRVRDNEYVRRGGAGNFLRASSTAAPISGEVSFNRVNIPDTDSSAYGILIASSGSGGFNVTVANNEVRSGFAFGAICALSNVPSGSAGASSIDIYGNVLVPLRQNVGTGVCVFGGEGGIESRISHNTIVGFGTAISLTARPFSPPLATQPITGYVIGNLLAHNGTALRRNSIAATPGDEVSNGQNLFFDNTTNFSGAAPAIAGSGTVTSDPFLYSMRYPYLRQGSAAIGRGNFLALPAGFPLLDADGTRRFKNVAGGGSNTIDIGAYEFGDDWFNTRANGSNNSANTLRLSHPSLNGTQSARALVTPNFSLGGVANSVPFGVFYDTTSLLWAVYNQNAAMTMPFGAGYSALTPAPGTGLLLHQVAPTGPTLSEAVLENSALNDLPDQIVVATSNWNPATPVGVYNNHNISLAYGPDDRWRIRNSDGVAFLNSASFNVYAQPPSISAFRHLVSEDNSNGTSTEIDNFRLNGYRCAELIVTPLSSYGNRQFDVFYDAPSARWRIFSTTTMPVGAEFNVVFSPRQITECAQPLFADGFEG